ncbi:MAG: hypothetical protein ACRDGU_01105 [Actinomycetota bacterium]
MTPPPLELASRSPRRERVEPRVHHHRGPVRIGVGGDPGGAKGHQGIGPSCVHAPVTLAARHEGKALGETLQRLGHHGTVGRWKLGFQAEAPAVVEVPPGQRTAPVRILNLFDRLPAGEISLVPDAGARHAPSPGDQPRFGLRRGEPGQLDDLVDTELTGGERL